MAQPIKQRVSTWAYYAKYSKGDQCGWGGLVWEAARASQSVEPRYQESRPAWKKTGEKHRIATTQKRCPMCGCNRWRNEDAICFDCFGRLRQGDEALAALRKQLETPSVMVTLDGRDVPYLAGDSNNWGDRVCDWIVNLAESVAVPLPPGFSRYDNTCEPLVGKTSRMGIDRDEAVFIPKTFHAALCGLWSAIVAMSDRQYKNGKDSGSNLLLGLATGETTIADFNKATIGASHSNNDEDE